MIGIVYCLLAVVEYSAECRLKQPRVGSVAGWRQCSGCRKVMGGPWLLDADRSMSQL